MQRPRLFLCAAVTAWALTMVSGSGAADPMVTVGITGHYRAGSWTAVRDLHNRPIAAIETRDGDGLRVHYDQLPDAGWAYAIPGSEAVPLILHYRSAEGQAEPPLVTRFPPLEAPDRGPALIPRQMPWVVALGDPLGMDTIGANELLGRAATVAVSRPATAAALPDSVLGYDGVDLIVIGGGSTPLLNDLSATQRSALTDWVTTGGQLFVTLGESAPAMLAAAPWLTTLLGLDQMETVRINPSALETYTSTQTPLEPFTGLLLPKSPGEVLLLARSERRTSVPLAVRYSLGCGQITAVAAGLDEPMFAQWPERMDLIRRLAGPLLDSRSDSRVVRKRATAYDDLAGQLRASLDEFSTQRRFNFSLVSLIVIALIALIGPLDYLLINRIFGRPRLGWLTWPLVVIGFSTLLMAHSRRLPDSAATAERNENDATGGVHCNRLEIIDVDTITRSGRGFAANYVYTHAAGRLRIEAAATESLTLLSDEISLLLTGPWGAAGEAFGGIPIAVEDARLPAYRDAFFRTAGTTHTSIQDLPMAARSSKGIFTRCQFQPRLTRQVVMRRRPGSELLDGSLVNPLPVDLLDGMLIYRNWVYLLPTRFPAGAEIASVGTLRQKNFRWLLTRQRLLAESETATEAWDPAMTDATDRIAQMLMFYRAAGGFNYTALRNDPLAVLDLSHVLTADQCLLVGRLAQPMTEIEIQHETGGPAAIPQGLALIRVILPVTEEGLGIDQDR